MLTARFAATLDPEWLRADTLALGRVPATSRTPDRYVLVEDNGAPILRCDIHVDGPQAYPFEDVVMWHDLMAAGFGGSLYCVHIPTRSANCYSFAGYFGSIHIDSDYCLAASDSEVLRLNRDGTLMWRRANCANDGIIISDVSDGVISGDAQMDAPNVWQPLRLSLSTGNPL